MADEIDEVEANYRKMITNGIEVLDEIRALAKQMDHPSIFDSYSTLLKALTESNAKLGERMDKTGVKVLVKEEKTKALTSSQIQRMLDKKLDEE
jgi:hypothetical protein